MIASSFIQSKEDSLCPLLWLTRLTSSLFKCLSGTAPVDTQQRVEPACSPGILPVSFARASTTNLAAAQPSINTALCRRACEHTKSQCCPHRRGLHPAMAFLHMVLSDVPKCSLLPPPFLRIPATNALFLYFGVTVPHQLNSVIQTSTATITDFSVTPTLVYPITVGMHKVKDFNIQGNFYCHSHTHRSEHLGLCSNTILPL